MYPNQQTGNLRHWAVALCIVLMLGAAAAQGVHQCASALAPGFQTADSLSGVCLICANSHITPAPIYVAEVSLYTPVGDAYGPLLPGTYLKNSIYGLYVRPPPYL